MLALPSGSPQVTPNIRPPPSSGTPRSAGPAPYGGGVDRADPVDRVGLRGRLVRTMPADPREAQRQPAGVAGARLDAVEGDLHDQLGSHVDDVTVARDLELEQALGLPGEHRVRQALERLPEHHVAARRV